MIYKLSKSIDNDRSRFKYFSFLFVILFIYLLIILFGSKPRCLQNEDFISTVIRNGNSDLDHRIDYDFVGTKKFILKNNHRTSAIERYSRCENK